MFPPLMGPEAGVSPVTVTRLSSSSRFPAPHPARPRARHVRPARTRRVDNRSGRSRVKESGDLDIFLSDIGFHAFQPSQGDRPLMGALRRRLLSGEISQGGRR